MRTSARKALIASTIVFIQDNPKVGLELIEQWLGLDTIVCHHYEDMSDDECQREFDELNLTLEEPK